MIDDRIDRQEHEIHSRMKHDRAHPGECRTHRGSRRCILSDRHFDDSLPPKLLVDIVETRAAVPRAPYALSEDEHAFIASQELGVRFTNRVGIREGS